MEPPRSLANRLEHPKTCNRKMTMGGSPGRGLKVFLPVPLPEVIDVTRTGRRAADLRTCLIFLPFVAGGSADMVVLILVHKRKVPKLQFYLNI